MLTIPQSLEWSGFERCLNELQPLISDSRWDWAVLHARSRDIGKRSQFINGLISKAENRGKPYFLGRTAEGMPFVGLWGDLDSTFWVTRASHSRHVVRFLRDVINKRTGGYIDIGANGGVLSALVAKGITRDIAITAFEPVPETARRAAATFALNGMRHAKLFAIAVADRAGVVEMITTPGFSGQASIHKVDRMRDSDIVGNRISVPMQSLDGLLASRGIVSPGVIKIDVEGHEKSVILGARQLIKEFGPDIIWEYNPRAAEFANWTPEEIAGIITSCNPAYKFSVINKDLSLSSFPPSNTNEVVDIYSRI